ncbi:helix-turn-helix transcriptional regulator [Roseimaritima ulvae]|uniref:helix-turn-helix transcriptional regulator n=1 Tax=Roseimaritima ulvae TaxID=980254 RepID=UPI0009FDE819
MLHENELRRMLAANDVAKLFGISTRTLWRWVSSGRIMRPLTIGETKRWDRQKLEEWIESGCPAIER